MRHFRAVFSLQLDDRFGSNAKLYELLRDNLFRDNSSIRRRSVSNDDTERMTWNIRADARFASTRVGDAGWRCTEPEVEVAVARDT